MAAHPRFSGLLTPVVTPFKPDLSPDPARFVTHCRWLLSQHSGLAPFGTTSEGNSLAVEEKMSLLERLAESGIPAASLMPGTGHCALTDTIRLTKHAIVTGCGGVLMLPPFFYKDVSEDGLFRSIAEVIERVGNDGLRIYLYHIPPVARVGFSPALVERLATRYPTTIAGIKDSSGDWANTEALLKLGIDDFRVFAGSESFLLRNMQGGGAGCISATANINAAAICELIENWRSASAEAMQRRLDQVRRVIEKHPVIPAIKAVIADLRGDSQWATVRPPLTSLSDDQALQVLNELRQSAFRAHALNY